MGLRGPAAKPSEQKKLEGTYRADRAARNEPKPQVIIPPCPKWLAPTAKAEYKRLAKMLVDLRVMTEADRLALGALSYQFSKWLEAEGMVGLEGRVLTSEKGGMYLNPWEGIANTAFKNMLILLREFGLTPASRARIEAQPEEEKQTSLAEKLFATVSLSD